MTTLTTPRAFETAASLLLATTLLAGGALIAGRVLRRRGGGPDARSLLYRATLCASAFSVLLILAALVVARPAPLLRVPLPVPSAPTTFANTAPEPATTQPDPTFRETPPTSDVRPAGSPIGTVVFGVWLVGTLALLIRLLVAHSHLRRLRVRAESRAPEADLRRELAACAAAQTGVTPAPSLLVSAHVRSPFLAGVFRPVLFVPAAFGDDFDADARRAIFAHELAHLRRRDCAWNLLARIVCALVWPQPLLWLVARRLEEANEEACDAVVVVQASEVRNGRRAYADCLVRLAEASSASQGRGLVPLGGAGVVPAFRSSLGRRVEQILKGPETMKSVSLPVRVCVALAALLVATASVFLVSFSSPAPSRAAQTSSANRAPEPPPITLKEEGITFAEFLEKVFEQAKPAGVTYTVQGELPRTPLTVDLKTASFDRALKKTLQTVKFTVTRTGNVYEVKPMTTLFTRDEKRANVRRVLNDLLTQAGVRYKLAGDVRGTVSVSFKDATPEDALWQITRAATPRLQWSDVGDIYVVTRAPKLARPTVFPRVSVNATDKRVADVLQRMFEQAAIRGDLQLHVEENERVSVHLNDVPLDQALTRVCAQASPPLTWSWDEYEGSIIVKPRRP